MSGNKIIRIFFAIFFCCCFIFYWKLHNMDMRPSEIEVTREREKTEEWLNQNPDFTPDAAWLAEHPEFADRFGNVTEPKETAAPVTSEPDPTTDPGDPASPEGTGLPQEPEGRADGLPDVDLTAWNLILVNKEEENYFNDGETPPPLTDFEGHQVDERIIEPLQSFVGAARAEGLSVVINSGYRSYADQNYLYNRKVAQVGDPEQAAKIVYPPGHSEHETGLCLDIANQFYETKDSSLENTSTFQWMQEHCWEYGFIVRYPKDKQEITDCIYEPWHFRYVGIEAAEYIMKNGICLEEFYDLYNS